jgi:uncharacterized membrane protein SirB2
MMLLLLLRMVKPPLLLLHLHLLLPRQQCHELLPHGVDAALLLVGAALILKTNFKLTKTKPLHHHQAALGVVNRRKLLCQLHCRHPMKSLSPPL